MAAIGTVMSGIKAGISKDAKALLGGDVELRQLYTPLEEKPRAFLGEQATVSEVTDMRSMAMAGEERAFVELRGVDALYPLFGKLETEPALPLPVMLEQKDGIWGAVVDDEMLEALSLKIGDVFSIGNARFRINAVIDREPDRSITTFSLGLRVIAQKDALAATGLIVPGSMINYRYRVKLNEPESLESWKQQLADTFPHAGWNQRDYHEATPALLDVLDRIALFFALTGLTALVTAGIGIGNATHAYLWTKQMTIATLKCLGLTQRETIIIYLMQLLIAAIPAIAGGVLLGLAGGVILMEVARPFLPTAAVQGIYAVPLILSAAFGIMTVLLFSLLPLARTMGIKPTALFRGAVETMETRYGYKVWLAGIFLWAAMVMLAITYTGMTTLPFWYAVGMTAALMFFYALAWLIKKMAAKAGARGAKNLSLRMAASNLSRPGAATGSVVIALGIGTSVMIALALVAGSLRAQIEEGLPEKAPAFFLLDIQPDQQDAVTAALSAMQGIGEIRHTPMIRGRITALNGVPVDQIDIPPDARWAVRGDRGATWTETIPGNARLAKGEWWPADYQGPPLVSFDAKLARSMGLDIGDTLTMTAMGKDVTATIASLRDIQWGTLEMNFTTIFSPGSFGDMPYTTLASVVASKQSEWPAQKMLADDFPNVSVIRVRDALKQLGDLLRQMSNAVLITAAITVGCGILVMAGAMITSLQKRLSDMVMLKVLGVTRGIMLKILTLEFTLMALAVAVASILIGSFAAWQILQLLVFTEFTLLLSVLVLTVAGSIIISTLVGMLAARHALAAKPLAYLRNE